MLVVAIKSVSALQCTLMAPANGGRLCHEEVSPAKKKSFTISSTDRQPLFSFYVSAQVEAVWQFGSQLAPRQQRQRQLELLSEAMTLGCGCRCWHFRLVIATNFFIRTSEIEKPFHWINIFCIGGEKDGVSPQILSRGKKSQHFCRIIAHTCNIAGQTQMTTVNR